MSKPGFAERISSAEVMSSGLEGNAERVVRRGLDDSFRTKLVADRQAAIVLNNEQERLKALLKAKTEELDSKMEEVDKAMAEAKKVVKLEFAKTQWAEFGITDKQ
ncbi:MAG: hypothetical protein Q8909_15220 [Bacteroidota bacterium]|nr:hypothetical protein [Bacteroidota bacterium]